MSQNFPVPQSFPTVRDAPPSPGSRLGDRLGDGVPPPPTGDLPRQSPRPGLGRFLKGGGLLLLISVSLHGLLLSLPLPQSPRNDDLDPAMDEVKGEAIVAISTLPTSNPGATPEAPPPPPEVSSVPPPAVASPPAPAAPATPATSAPDRPDAPTPAPPSEETAPAFTAPASPTANSPATEESPPPQPTSLFGVPAPPGSQPIDDPADWLPGDRLALHWRDGALHPDIVGQFVVEAPPGTDAQAWFTTHYQPLLEEGYAVRSEGAFVRAPKYSLSGNQRRRFAFITLESLPHTPHLLVTVWQRNPT